VESWRTSTAVEMVGVLRLRSERGNWELWRKAINTHYHKRSSEGETPSAAGLVGMTPRRAAAWLGPFPSSLLIASQPVVSRLPRDAMPLTQFRHRSLLGHPLLHKTASASPQFQSLPKACSFLAAFVIGPRLSDLTGPSVTGIVIRSRL
jgi:hypothetical protein